MLQKVDFAYKGKLHREGSARSLRSLLVHDWVGYLLLFGLGSAGNSGFEKVFLNKLINVDAVCRGATCFVWVC